jgi:16S rRNA G966 N2-methylase RsmD
MIEFEYIKCPLNRYTFSVKPVRQWVERHCEGKVLNLFAGRTKLAVDEVRNDIEFAVPAEYHMDAVVFLKSWRGQKFDTILLDPPYSYRKSMEIYGGKMCSPFRQLKDEVAGCLEPAGKVITFGYHSVSMGSARDFRIEKVCLFSHGGAIHDTIATIERHETHQQ